jgi:hypothetical protein
MKTPVQVGDRVRITGPMDDPYPIPIGTEGTVDWVGKWFSEHTRQSMPPPQIGVKWDNGRTLMLLGSDPYMVIRG